MALNGRYQREMAAFTAPRKNAHKSTPTHTHSSYAHTKKDRKFVKCLNNMCVCVCIALHSFTY